jgi:Ca-activated chloride channel family protein
MRLGSLLLVSSVAVVALSPPLDAQKFDAAADTLSVRVRLVEVHAAVLDQKGRYLSGLNAGQFQLMEDGRPQKISLFEAQSSTMTLALLVDTTGSMAKVLPHVKNAVAQLVSAMKPEDSIGLFSFRNRLSVLQPFTRDHGATLKALLATRAAGSTALFDSLTQLAIELSGTNGKKAILLFTDGEDNSSLLSMQQALETVKRNGFPIYAVSQGSALQNKTMLNRLQEISRVTGGIAFEVRQMDEIATAFNRIAADLQHLYLLAYYPSVQENSRWRKINVVLPEQKGLKIRAKEGYLP